EADIVEARFLDPFRVTIVGLRRQRVADIGIFLMPVDAVQEHAFAIDAEPRLVDGDATDANTGFSAVDVALTAGDGGDKPVPVGVTRRPERAVVEDDPQLASFCDGPGRGEAAVGLGELPLAEEGF